MNDEEMIHSCPVCSSGNTGGAFKFPDLVVFRCRACGHHYQHPYPAQELLASIFQGLYDGDPGIIERYFPEWRLFYSKDSPDARPNSCRRMIERRLRLAEDFAEPGIVLDIGCGFGQFLEIARERGWEGAGVEMSPPAAEYVRAELGFSVFETIPDDLTRYRLITLWDVLEHQSDPGEFLRSISYGSAEGSVLAIAVPGRQSIITRLPETIYRATCGRITCGLEKYYVVTHLHYFIEEGLSRLMERAGYRVLFTGRESTCLAQLDLGQPAVTALRIIFGVMRLFKTGNRLLIYGMREKAARPKANNPG